MIMSAKILVDTEDQRHTNHSLRSRTSIIVAESIFAIGDHDSSVRQNFLVSQLRSTALADQMSETRSSTRIEAPAVSDLNSPEFSLGVVSEKELWFGLEVVGGSKIFLIQSG
jgi:hypothetical protein